MKSEAFEAALEPPDLEAWNSIRIVITNVLGKHRAPNSKHLVENMLNEFKNLAVHMSLKIHLLHQHFDYFDKQLASESDEQGERYHQVAVPFEIRLFVLTLIFFQNNETMYTQ